MLCVSAVCGVCGGKDTKKTALSDDYCGDFSKFAAILCTRMASIVSLDAENEILDADYERLDAD